MLRSLDNIPQENFYMIAGPALLSGTYPSKAPRSTVFAVLLGSLSLFLFINIIINELFDVGFTKLLSDVVLICGAPLILFILLLSFRKIVKSSPGLCTFAILFSLFHLRMTLWLFVTVLTVATYDNANFICTLAIVLFFAAELFWNTLMYLRITNRIREGKYSFEGTGFWNSQKVYDRMILAVKVISFLIAAMGILHFVGELNDDLDFTSIDFQELINALSITLFAAGAILLSCVFAYFNIKQSIMLYCFNRFSDSIEAFSPPDEEEPEDEYDEYDE
ncbi:MAG: hypothetical protein E7546_08010 [Ruminococcaceae bacterium]|nr:hypothetical protein [Oscillospiraceae bacterium]